MTELEIFEKMKIAHVCQECCERLEKAGVVND